MSFLLPGWERLADDFKAVRQPRQKPSVNIIYAYINAYNNTRVTHNLTACHSARFEMEFGMVFVHLLVASIYLPSWLSCLLSSISLLYRSKVLSMMSRAGTYDFIVLTVRNIHDGSVIGRSYLWIILGELAKLKLLSFTPESEKQKIPCNGRKSLPAVGPPQVGTGVNRRIYKLTLPTTRLIKTIPIVLSSGHMAYPTTRRIEVITRHMASALDQSAQVCSLAAHTKQRKIHIITSNRDNRSSTHITKEKQAAAFHRHRRAQSHAQQIPLSVAKADSRPLIRRHTFLENTIGSQPAFKTPLFLNRSLFARTPSRDLSTLSSLPLNTLCHIWALDTPNLSRHTSSYKPKIQSSPLISPVSFPDSKQNRYRSSVRVDFLLDILEHIPQFLPFPSSLTVFNHIHCTQFFSVGCFPQIRPANHSSSSHQRLISKSLRSDLLVLGAFLFNPDTSEIFMWIELILGLLFFFLSFRLSSSHTLGEQTRIV
ncbi:hypothetical protein VP01_271g1 [Puccinia sorghi]|uniref:Uncharacterized protein n=1 Tax=Puccinia sorghi TaxID=27349 RepID=A0A0L6V3G2_9BASI|nr:hypothetical protein VP01_271g1 [Puccinia sorghi]